MPAGLPPLDFDSMNEADIRQLYYKIFQLMKEDFAVKGDIETMMQDAFVSGGSLTGITASPPAPLAGSVVAAKIVFHLPEITTEATAAKYEVLATTGAAVRKATIEGAKGAVGGK